MNAKEIIQQASITLGFEKPETIEEPQDTNAQRLLGQLNRAVEEILRDYDWQQLVRQCEFIADKTTNYNAALKGYAVKKIAGGFDYFLTDFIYNLTQRQRITSIDYDAYSARQMFKGSAVQQFIMQDNHIIFIPELPIQTKLSFFYKSKFPVVLQDASGNIINKEFFSADNDESILDDKLVLRGLIWKYKNELGFDYAEAYRDYQTALNKAKDQDTIRRRINTDKINRLALNIPDSGIG